MTFRIALSGLSAATSDLEVTGNNIANANTVGFKESRAEFNDVYASAVQDLSSSVAGGGVRVSRVAQQFQQGSVDFTSNNLDLAISGEGFFVVQDPDGTQYYTRAGAYSVDREGYVVNQASQRLQVYDAVTGSGGNTSFATGALSDLQLPTGPSEPTATTTITNELNLNATDEVPTLAFDPANPATYNASTSTTIYDSLGNAHTATYYFSKAADNDWLGRLYVDGNAVTSGGSDTFDLEFSSSGALITPADGTVTTDAHTPGGGGADLNLTLDFTGTTQFGASFAVNDLSQDGYTSGRLAGVDIDTEGVVFARYTNGRSAALAKVAMAKFNNIQGLRQVGDTNWTETFSSGSVQLGQAGTSSFGQIQSGALESSNVDIAEQLVNLITAQRNFQANSEVISTADQITQSILNIR